MLSLALAGHVLCMSGLCSCSVGEGVVRTMGLLGRVELPGEAWAVGVARSYLRELLTAVRFRAWDDTVLLVSELAANAVRHSATGLGGTMTITVADLGDGEIRVEVRDDGSAGSAPVVGAGADPDGESGRGLWLVSRLAADWGVEDHDAGRTVWFRLAS